MRKLTSGLGGLFANGMALITVVASVVLMIFYGKVEIFVPGKYGGPPTAESVMNWPLIVSAAVSSVYALLFAALFNYVETARNAIVDIANHMGVKPGQQ